MDRSESLAFNQLDQGYVSKLRDAFNTLDVDGDGKIGRDDLVASLASVGKSHSDAEVDAMLAGTTEINFASYLTLMSHARMSETVDEDALRSSLLELARVNGDGTETLDQETLLKYLRDAGFFDPEAEFEKLFQTFTSRGSFQVKQFMDTISEK
ncbi:Mlc2p KNAG_0F04000 [Huiozyma naganishii CBS 8797]|uniref:EF-hand domain-containing protein n=1 Tax=Huiozyma naganishii (strain ATCC MYA-139 / BCRC 22969 / CBS 8797 / KCTC 17520 / NBRC 10181 / NCYC 3082 / Yp74L-3) TaxID=1071383 RepID=J7S7N3_HUIN7|nr:hypothetical protein KNAG_0F04000 [Kazachstania naganishii CBS 8797]CCK71064.1 hypothetical protein KNAG_0F04000 [Kazachstania naganishii CBS 8797]